MTLSPLKKFLIISLIPLAITIALLFAFIFISNHIFNYRDTLQVTMGNLVTNEKDFNHMQKISELIKNRNQDIQRIKHIAIDHERPLVFIETIEQIGRISGVKVTLTVNDKSDNAHVLVFRATLDGSEKNVRDMLALIQELPYQIKIENVSFQRDVVNNFTAQQTILRPLTHLLLTMNVKTL